MTNLPYPDWASDADLDATDRALDAVGRREPAPPDPSLNALALLARHVDVRAAALTQYARTVPPAGRSRPVTTPGHVGTHRTVRSGTAPRPDRGGPGRRPRRPMRLFALPLVALLAITLTVATAASGSPNTPLYPLHQLLFHQPSPPDEVRQQLASAQQALDRAGKSSGADRLAALADARDHLTRAHDLMPSVTDAADRDRLDGQLSSLDDRAEQMDGSDTDHDQNGQQQTGGPAPHGTGQRGDTNDHRREPPTGPASPTADSSHGDDPGHN
jgi:hypothetical protein